MEGSDGVAERAQSADSGWLAAQALKEREADAGLRSWLTTPGLLTERVRAAVGEQFRVHVVEECMSGGDFLRRIELGRDDEPWIYAETNVPSATLARHPWLATIGSRSLGEVLATFAGSLRRSEFAFALLDDGAPIVARARALAMVSARVLWVRRSTLCLDDAPFVVQEVFLPVVAERGARARIA
jgi:chorismate-pyruvate lyase